MEILFIVGRLLFGGYFLLNGINHFTKTEMLSAYAASKGVPSPKAAVYVGGLLLLAGGAGVLLGIYVKLAIAAIVLFLVPVSFEMHNFWAVSDPNMKMADMVNFLKNMALAGAALMILSIPEPWNFSL